MKLTKLLSCLLICSSIVSPVSAITNEEYVAETGTIKISYFDDSSQNTPVVGSVWKLIKVADINTNLEENTEDGLVIESCIKGLEITGKTTPEEVLSHIKYEKKDESKLDMKDESNNGEKLFVEEKSTDHKGQIVFDKLPFGVYLGVEVDASEYHLLASPFLISMPNTDEDGKTSHIETTVMPKAVLGGHVNIQKLMVGDRVDRSRIWDVAVYLPDGVYRYEKSNGDVGTIRNKDWVTLKCDEHITIYDVLAGEKYSFTEIQESQEGYITGYRNRGEPVKYRDTKYGKVVNEKWAYQQKNTGDYIEKLKNGDVGTIAATVAIPAGVGLLVIAYFLTKDKKNK